MFRPAGTSASPGSSPVAGTPWERPARRAGYAPHGRHQCSERSRRDRTAWPDTRPPVRPPAAAIALVAARWQPRGWRPSRGRRSNSDGQPRRERPTRRRQGRQRLVAVPARALAPMPAGSWWRYIPSPATSRRGHRPMADRRPRQARGLSVRSSPRALPHPCSCPSPAPRYRLSSPPATSIALSVLHIAHSTIPRTIHSTILQPTHSTHHTMGEPLWITAGMEMHRCASRRNTQGRACPARAGPSRADLDGPAQLCHCRRRAHSPRRRRDPDDKERR